jgi:hypothetical protein
VRVYPVGVKCIKGTVYSMQLESEATWGAYVRRPVARQAIGLCSQITREIPTGS